MVLIAKKLTLKDQILCAIFSIIMAICAQISISFFQVPFTMQIFSVALVSVILGCKRAFISQIVYLLLGAIGLPVFAGFQGGIQILLGPTGGYIISFVFMALIIGYFSEKYPNKYLFIIASSLFGLIICYVVGTFQLSIILNFTFINAIKIGVIPFIIFDLAKILLGIYLGINVKRIIKL